MISILRCKWACQDTFHAALVTRVFRQTSRSSCSFPKAAAAAASSWPNKSNEGALDRRSRQDFGPQASDGLVSLFLTHTFGLCLSQPTIAVFDLSHSFHTRHNDDYNPSKALEEA